MADVRPRGEDADRADVAAIRERWASYPPPDFAERERFLGHAPADVAALLAEHDRLQKALHEIAAIDDECKDAEAADDELIRCGKIARAALAARRDQPEE